VAVIVVPGVGDDGLGDTASTLSHSMVRQGYFDWAIHDEVTVTSQLSSAEPGGADTSGEEAFVPPPPDRYAAPRRRLGRGSAMRPAGARSQPSDQTDLEVDIYEMNWADLSRFPAGLLRFVFALFGLVLQLGRAGIESTRHIDHEPDDWRLVSLLREGRMPRRSAAWARAAAGALSWWLAIVVVPVTALVVLLCLGLWAATITPAGILQLGVVVVGAVLGAVALLMIGRGMARSGVRTNAVWVLAVGVIAVLVGALFGNGFSASSVPVLLANTLLGLSAFPLRIVWLFALVLSVVGVVASLLLLRTGHTRGEHQDRRWRAGSVNLLSVTVSPFALALVSGIVLASTSLVVSEALRNQTWGANAGEVRCLSSASDWTPEPCLSDAEQDLLEQESTRAESIEERPETPALPELEVNRELRREQAEDNATAVARSADAAPTDWIQRMFVQILEPVAFAALVLGAALLYLLIRQIVLRLVSLTPVLSRRRLLSLAGVPTYLYSITLGAFGLRPDASSRREEGAALTGLLTRLIGRSATVIVSLVSLAAVAGTFGIWIFGTSVADLPLVAELFPDTGFDSGAAVSIGVAGLLLLARFVPIDPRRLSDSVGGGLEKVRGGLDILYDVMTYVREGDTAARFSVVSRYRALLAQVTQIEHEDGRVGYDGIVFAAHSQGTVYTVATLFGDQARYPRIYPLYRGGEPRAYTGLRRTPRVSFLSFGSPIHQTYDRFFPDQYRDWYAGAHGTPQDGLLPLNDAWLNIYRPGDYVGRAVNRSPWGAASNEPDTREVVTRIAQAGRDGEPTGGTLELVESCINLPGAHTRYWSSAHVAANVNYLIERAAGLDPAPPELPLPTRSEIADRSARQPR
jgi:hypothetical protein